MLMLSYGHQLGEQERIVGPGSQSFMVPIQSNQRRGVYMMNNGNEVTKEYLQLRVI